jgi:hypothetical protein
MPVSQLPQAPYRQDRKIFPTPLTTDVLFSEVRDCTRTEFPEYGTPHPNAAKWPYHKLIFIKTVDIERDGIFEFFYAADRENQDLYNFESGYRNVIGNVGGREFRIVQRTYVNLRTEFNPLDIPFATPMMDVPEGQFIEDEYVFFDRQQKRIEDKELDALYVSEVHTYIEKAFLDYKLSYTTQKTDLIPEKFRYYIPQNTTEQIVSGLASQPVLVDAQTATSEDQINPDIKLVRIISRDVPDANISLNGQRAYTEGGPIANLTETYSKGSISVDTGVNVVQSSVSPVGDGSFIKETLSVDSWPQLKNSEWDYLLNAQVVRTEQMVTPPTVFTEPNTSFKAVNQDRSLKIVEEAPTAALQSYLISLPTRTDLQMPTVLKSLSTEWVFDESINNGSSEGNTVFPNGAVGMKLDASAGSSGNASVAAIPSIKIETETVFGNDISATIYFFYYNAATGSMSESNLIGRLSSLIGQSVTAWPIFKPKSHTIVANGARVNAVAVAQADETRLITTAGLEGKATSTKEEFTYSRDRNLDIVNLNPTIHGSITIQNATAYNTISVAASSSANLTGDFDTSASVSSSATASVSVSPTSFSATTPADIPRSGLYVVNSKAEPYKWGWIKCSAIVVNAYQFAS